VKDLPEGEEQNAQEIQRPLSEWPFTGLRYKHWGDCKSGM